MHQSHGMERASTGPHRDGEPLALHGGTATERIYPRLTTGTGSRLRPGSRTGTRTTQRHGTVGHRVQHGTLPTITPETAANHLGPKRTSTPSQTTEHTPRDGTRHHYTAATPTSNAHLTCPPHHNGHDRRAMNPSRHAPPPGTRHKRGYDVEDGAHRSLHRAPPGRQPQAPPTLDHGTTPHRRHPPHHPTMQLQLQTRTPIGDLEHGHVQQPNGPDETLRTLPGIDHHPGGVEHPTPTPG
jgi:hypothetical protein